MGRENIFIFGVKVDEVEQLQKRGYSVGAYIRKSAAQKQTRCRKCSEISKNGAYDAYEHRLDRRIRYRSDLLRTEYAGEIWGIATGETSPAAAYEHPDGVENSQ
ncbi:hypothetical protein Q1695_007378 [Nippostrongylus brasiliensis]|nr:hypothetical protein Q1695_007378 [Nippostrongylus brasiliensis]